MTEIKICGLRSEADVAAARDANYLGFVVGTGTRRSVGVSEAKLLMKGAGNRAVVVTTSVDRVAVAKMAEELRPHAMQLNGAADTRLVAELKRSGCEVWVAVHIGATIPSLDRSTLALADCVVLDTASPEGGGSGRAHDRRISAQVARLIAQRTSLAGGLNKDNVEQAIEIVHPDIVDVSSGVESNGVKDALKIERFIEKVRSCQ